MNTKTKQQRILRYAELASKSLRTALSKEELREQETIREELKMSHQKLVGTAEAIVMGNYKASS